MKLRRCRCSCSTCRPRGNVSPCGNCTARNCAARPVPGFPRWRCASPATICSSPIERYEHARAACARNRWPDVHDRRYAEHLAALRDERRVMTPVERRGTTRVRRIPLALVGGPLLGDDFALPELVARAGGHIVLDASEWGERTLPHRSVSARSWCAIRSGNWCEGISTRFPTCFAVPTRVSTTGLRTARCPEGARHPVLAALVLRPVACRAGYDAALESRAGAGCGCGGR